MARFTSSAQKKKSELKEKVIQLYETILKPDTDDPGITNPNFWDEMFLLKCNGPALEAELHKIPVDQLSNYKKQFNTIFNRCLFTLRGQNHIREANAFMTLSILTKEVLSKCKENPQIDSVQLLVGRENAELNFRLLLERFSEILISEVPNGLKCLVLNYLLIIVTAYDEVDDNPFMSFLMTDYLFDALFDLLADPPSRQSFGYKIIFILTALANYRKHKESNPYTVRLSIVDNEVALSGFAQVVSTSLSEFNKKFQMKTQNPKSSILSSLTSMVGNMFVADENIFEKRSSKIKTAGLLAFYEIVHLNRNFITLLTNTQTDTYEEMSSMSTHSDSTVDGKEEVNPISEPPTNLLVSFLEFCSIVMLPTRDDSNQNTVRLCFIILLCITEDHCANSIMHDVNLTYRVQLRRMPMRHRKVVDEVKAPSRPLACHILDLMVEFIMTHLKKNMILDLYLLCIGVIHRLLCYQKKSKIQSQFNWKELWSALVALLKFILNHEADLIKKWDIFMLSFQVVNIFNFFITFGDTFLPSPQVYDELYYEIIRVHVAFDNLHSLALRYSAAEGAQYKRMAAKLSSSLVNIRAIINHFNPKIDAYSAQYQTASLTEEQVLSVIRSNYDTLTLKLQDGLDQYESYSAEIDSETTFFSKLLQEVIIDYKSNPSHLILNPKEQQNLLHELKCSPFTASLVSS